MEWNDTALVTRVGRFRESDMWVRLLCRKHGLITVFAFGGSRSRRRFCGCLDVLNRLLVRVKSGRRGPFLALQEGVLLEAPQRLRHDWQRLGMAMNCTAFLEALGTGFDGMDETPNAIVPASPQSGDSDNAFAMLTELIALLENVESVPESLPALFRLRYVTMQGFAPGIEHCHACGAPVESVRYGHFAVDEGVLFCENCGARGGHSLRLSADALRFLRAIQTEQIHRWPEYVPEIAARREALRMIDAFVQYHVGVEWQHGRFRKS